MPPSPAGTAAGTSVAAPPSRGRSSAGQGLSLQLGLSARVHKAMNAHVTFIQMGGAIDKVCACDAGAVLLCPSADPEVSWEFRCRVHRTIRKRWVASHLKWETLQVCCACLRALS